MSSVIERLAKMPKDTRRNVREKEKITSPAYLKGAISKYVVKLKE